MFTGIVQEVGIVEQVRQTASGLSVQIKAPSAARSLTLGGSIATQGVCLTCVERSGGSFWVDISEETLRKTTLGELRKGDKVNLELPLRLVDRIGGHLVTGHVDGVGTVVDSQAEGAGRILTFEAPPQIMRYTIEKGSVAVDGVSLTAFHVTDRTFQVALIPHTLRVTTLGALRPGARVNLEADLLGKYVERLLSREGVAPRG